jgi:ureidoacrylate peracid hydrolase
MHPFIIPDAVKQTLIARRGKVDVFDALDAAKTVLLVIDMQRGFLEPGAPSEVAQARTIVPNINRLAAQLRRLGGLVAFSRAQFGRGEDEGWPSFFDHVVAPALSERIFEALAEGSPNGELWPDLAVAPGDIIFPKRRYSAFARHGSDIETALVERGIDTVLVAGTMTNFCCDSTARDAMQLGYKTIMISDANAARSDAEHSAALLTFLVGFGDVRPADEIIALLERGAAGV